MVPLDDLVQYCGGIHSGEVSDSSIFDLALYKGSQVGPKIPAVLAAIPTEISICVSSDSNASTQGSLELLATYNSALFLKDIISFMMEQLIQILHGALSDPSKPIGTITMLTESQRRLLPDPTQNLHWNDFVGPILEIFDRNAIRRPDHPCIIETSYADNDERIHSYRKIYEASNIVAHYLQYRGIACGDVIMVYAYRNADLVVAIMSILKCGAIFPIIGNSRNGRANDRSNLSTNASDNLLGSR